MAPPSVSDFDIKAYKEGDFYIQDYSMSSPGGRTGMFNSGMQSPSKFKNVTWHFIPENSSYEQSLMRRSPKTDKVKSRELHSKLQTLRGIEKQINMSQNDKHDDLVEQMMTKKICI
jgi:hypothetical protein